MKKILTIIAALGMIVLSCSKDEVEEYKPSNNCDCEIKYYERTYDSFGEVITQTRIVNTSQCGLVNGREDITADTWKITLCQ